MLDRETSRKLHFVKLHKMAEKRAKIFVLTEKFTDTL